MIRIREIDHIVLRVRNLTAMQRFYCEVLGCAIERRQSKYGLVHLRGGNCLIDLVDVDGELGRRGGQAPGNEGHNIDHICFRIEPFDADQISRHLAHFSISAEPPQSRYGAEGFGLSIYISDPEGNIIELKGPPDPSMSL